MEKNMETTIVYWGSVGIMEKKLETTELQQQQLLLLLPPMLVLLPDDSDVHLLLLKNLIRWTQAS